MSTSKQRFGTISLAGGSPPMPKVTTFNWNPPSLTMSFPPVNSKNLSYINFYNYK